MSSFDCENTYIECGRIACVNHVSVIYCEDLSTWAITGTFHNFVYGNVTKSPQDCDLVLTQVLPREYINSTMNQVGG